MQGRPLAGYRAPVGVTLGLAGAAIALLVALIAIRRRPRRTVAPTQIRPGDPVVGLPPRNPHVAPRALSEAPRAITGPPGIGKSTTAYEYAHRRLDDYRFVGVVHAARTAYIPDAYGAFASALGIEPTADPVAAVHRALAEREAWLIIFDDAGTPGELAPFLPPDGHYLVTSSAPGWDGDDLKPLTRDESIAFLRDRGIDRKTAKELAEALEDAPLALDLAAGYVDVTDTNAHAYLVRVRTQMSRIRRGPLPALWSLTASYLRSRTPATFEALEMWAALGTEPIPLNVLGGGADAELAARLGLVLHTGDHVLVHPLVRDLVRSGPDIRRRWAVLRAAYALRAYLTDASDAQWRSLLPHIDALLERPELAGDRTMSWLQHHIDFLAAEAADVKV